MTSDLSKYRQPYDPIIFRHVVLRAKGAALLINYLGPD